MIDGGQLHEPTPCEDYDVSGLLTHLISGNFWVAPLVEGKSIDDVGDAYDGDDDQRSDEGLSRGVLHESVFPE